MKIDIDKFDLLNWLEGCSIGSHLRQGIWRRCIDEFYSKLTAQERLWLYTYAKRDITDRYKDKSSCGREDFFKFLACYNPANRYTVIAEGIIDGKKQKQRVKAFRFQGDFWVSYQRYIAPEYVKLVKKDTVKVDKCAAGYCPKMPTCARYTDDKKAGIFGAPLAISCDWYINKNTTHGSDIEL